MKQLTYEFLIKKHYKIEMFARNNGIPFGFDCEEAWMADFVGQDVQPNVQNRITLIKPEKGFIPGNLKIVTIHDESDLLRYPFPTI